MTAQNPNSLRLSDEDLEMASGGTGQWVQPSKGTWWVWKQETQSFAGDASSFHSQVSSSSGTVRSEVIDGKTHFYKFDGTKEHLVGVR